MLDYLNAVQTATPGIPFNSCNRSAWPVKQHSIKASESLFVNYLYEFLLNFVLNWEMFVAGRTCSFVSFFALSYIQQ